SSPTDGDAVTVFVFTELRGKHSAASAHDHHAMLWHVQSRPIRKIDAERLKWLVTKPIEQVSRSHIVYIVRTSTLKCRTNLCALARSPLGGYRLGMTSDSGRTVSVWMATADTPEQEALGQDTTADVCVVGAGIAGMSTAYLLA